jgi:hypothetical protein
LGDLRDVLAALAFQTSLIPLEKFEPRDRYEILLTQRRNAVEFLGDKRDLFFFRLLKRRQADDLLLALIDAFVKLRALAGSAVAA